jgi:UDP-glucose 4-epimerase
MVRAAVRSDPDPAFTGNVEVVKHLDLVQPIDWRPLLEETDTVIHLAGIAHITTGLTADLYNRVNHLATAQAAAAAAKFGVRHFVFISSIRAQCGPTSDHVLTERDRPAPSDPYGRSKLAAEAAVSSSGVPFTILRPVLLYGPGVKGNFATLLRIAQSTWPLPLKRFNNRRSLLGIENFISALNFVLEAPNTLGKTYIVADPGTAPSLAELIALMRQTQGLRTKLFPIPGAILSIPLRLLRRGDLWQRVGEDLQADPAELIAAGWRPKHGATEGVVALASSMTKSA